MNQKEKSTTELNDEFIRCCASGHLEGVKYVLTSPELKKHANIHMKNDLGFVNAYIYGHLDIIQYFIFDLNIEKTKAIKKYLKKYPNEQVEKMFVLRELNQNLERDLSSDKTNKKKIKL